jgi:betaine-aldehyde dehydrogenase
MAPETTIELTNFIGGEHVASADGRSEEILNPATGEVIAQATQSSAVDVDRAVAAAKEAAPTWAQTPVSQRSRALLRLADACEEHFEELVRLEVLDAGKPVSAMRNDELPVIIDNIRFAAGAARNLDSLTSAEYVAQHTSVLRREPYGVIAGITPWNYPLWQAVLKIAPAIATGNTVVIKPAESTPMTTLRFAELASDFLPTGVLNVS